MIGDLGSCHPVPLWLAAMLLLLPPMTASADCYGPGREATAAGRWAEAVEAFDAAARRADCAGSGDILRYNAAVSALREAAVSNDPARACAAVERFDVLLADEALDADIAAAARAARVDAAERCGKRAPSPAPPGRNAEQPGADAADPPAVLPRSTESMVSPPVTGTATPPLAAPDREAAWILTGATAAALAGAAACYGLSRAAHFERASARSAWARADDTTAPLVERRFHDANTRTFAWGLSGWLLVGVGVGLGAGALWSWLDDGGPAPMVGVDGIGARGRW